MINFKNNGLGVVSYLSALMFMVIITAGMPTLVSAHCDSMDGPVIIEAQDALDKNNVTPLLKWVTKNHEKDIRKSFNQTIKARSNGKKAGKAADRSFFETLVRIHRAGEGAPYTGIKPAGTIAPAVAKADSTIIAGSADALSKKIANAVRNAILKRFKVVSHKKKSVNKSVDAGREYVEAYVNYIHFVEGIHNMVAHGGGHDHSKK